MLPEHLRISYIYNSDHRITKVRSAQTNGFVERFHWTLQEELFQVVFRQNLYLTLEELQTDLDEWLVFYNTECPHLGYRNMERKPIEALNQYNIVQLREKKNKSIKQYC